MHYHGTPITPLSELHTLRGRNFCVSFARPDQVEHVHRIGQSVMLDNGAFSVWRRGAEVDWDAWRVWAERWLEHRSTWAVLPDSITGGVEENDQLLRRYAGVPGVPVWHLHEPLARLSRLVYSYERVAFGSSGDYAVVRSAAWHRRVSEAFEQLADDFGRVPWVHMLRGMALSGSGYPFASVDSTDVARNHNRAQNTALGLAQRWDRLQCPPRWQGQSTIEEEATA